MGVAVIVRGGELWGVLHGMIADPAMVLLVGMLSLAAGLAVIFVHNKWQGGVTVIAVTLIGWLMAVRGALLVVFPSLFIDIVNYILENSSITPAFTAFALGLGAWLTFASFMGKVSS